MLEKVDVSKKMGKVEFKQLVDELQNRLSLLQRQARDAKIPIIIVFEGLDAADKGTLINELIQPLDPRGFDVFAMRAPGEEEILRPYFWRFWTKTPAKGRIAIFYRGWYRRMLFERVDEALEEQEISEGFHDIQSFERQLADDGYLIIKMFLHIGKKEQKERLKAMEDDPATAWQVGEAVWHRHRKYDAYLSAAEEMIRITDSDYAPWTIIEAHDKRFAISKIMLTVAEALAARISSKADAAENKSVAANEQADVNQISPQMKFFNSSVLADLDLNKSIESDEYEQRLKKLQDNIRELEAAAYRKRLPIAVVFEGWDAAGKGGSIRRLTENIDPRGYNVIPTAAPNDEEKAHHYLWRFWRDAPKAGHITIFDRSWYGRVLVERVESLCSSKQWKRSYQEINEMERQWTHFGVVLLKFWLQIDKDEQQRRFEGRLQNPDKQWKITGEDWRNREKWNQYEIAIDEMFFRTSTTYAPWTIIEANSKQYARIKILENVVRAMEHRL